MVGPFHLRVTFDDSLEVQTVNTVAVTICPPGPIDHSMHFDRNQFVKTRIRVSSATSGLAFNDIQSMTVRKRAEHPYKTKWVAQWAFNDEQFRRVVLAKCWSYVHAGLPCPNDLTKDEAKKIADQRFKRMSKREYAIPGSFQWNIHETHKRAVANAGGYLEFWSLVLYRALRLQEDSVSVAQQMGLTPVHVRQALSRANQIARALGFEVYEISHTSTGRKVKPEVGPEAARIRARRKRITDLGKSGGVIRGRFLVRYEKTATGWRGILLRRDGRMADGSQRWTPVSPDRLPARHHVHA